MKTGVGKLVGVMGVLLIGILALSFFITTWLAMILAGMVGHFADSAWLKSLSFWECSPIWVMVLILKVIFGSKGS